MSEQNPKPGYKTTEFWIAIVSQFLALLMIAGVISPTDKTTLEGSLSSTVTAVATIISSVWVVLRYIDCRWHLKTPLVLLALLFLPDFASAQAMPWRRRVEDHMRQHQAQPQQQAPQTDPALINALQQLSASHQALINHLQRADGTAVPAAADHCAGRSGLPADSVRRAADPADSARRTTEAGHPDWRSSEAGDTHWHPAQARHPAGRSAQGIQGTSAAAPTGSTAAGTTQAAACGDVSEVCTALIDETSL